MKRSGSAAWSGSLREGKGSVSTESHAMDSYPYTFFSRYGEKLGTNPEELLGAAHDGLESSFVDCGLALRSRKAQPTFR